ncbi:hypothetical protein GUITHDRAFT_101724 [Guillardia theta CCMP2712]|uniref:Uncharacterized protein n=1 Tax=Guillardia theta (strain CCMP2712) TaxID=905079 RepID=L1JVE3_GUITC|nr:hypothetical protein GUITHDRAFT_101724 [Guillardia theta CCMP2712]EKX52556.1 hypothetical protein GUITHDRAFT_101724 [Guillardia theta CCMP2712]|eukprot:XP_005839536.1 hypothetical protein GUITHDRAFT_101724 [Guillardia theta CCMP2712]
MSYVSCKQKNPAKSKITHPNIADLYFYDELKRTGVIKDVVRSLRKSKLMRIKPVVQSHPPPSNPRIQKRHSVAIMASNEMDPSKSAERSKMLKRRSCVYCPVGSSNRRSSLQSYINPLKKPTGVTYIPPRPSPSNIQRVSQQRSWRVSSPRTLIANCSFSPLMFTDAAYLLLDMK